MRHYIRAESVPQQCSDQNKFFYLAVSDVQLEAGHAQLEQVSVSEAKFVELVFQFVVLLARKPIGTQNFAKPPQKLLIIKESKQSKQGQSINETNYQPSKGSIDRVRAYKPKNQSKLALN